MMDATFSPRAERETERATALVCAECGQGNYAQGAYGNGECGECGHAITGADLVLDDGERVAFVWDVLCVITH